jgi:hypothetical protein
MSFLTVASASIVEQYRTESGREMSLPVGTLAKSRSRMRQGVCHQICPQPKGQTDCLPPVLFLSKTHIKSQTIDLGHA